MSQTITTPQGDFTADVSGSPDGPAVLLLHGYPQTRRSWRDQVPALGAAGYRAVAFDQRGYSPGVRPDPARDLSAYSIDRLVADVLDVAAAVTGDPDARFHLVGHDWGGSVAWAVAARHPKRVASLAVLSRPHPAAFRRALEQDADGQRHRSRHHKAFQDPATASLLLADDARRLRATFARNSVPEPAAAEYLSVLQEPAALEAAVSWYRARRVFADTEPGPIQVPTLYLWGDADSTVGPTAARLTAEYVAAAYRFEILRGVGHFITDEAPDVVTAHLLRHFSENPIGNSRR